MGQWNTRTVPIWSTTGFQGLSETGKVLNEVLAGSPWEGAAAARQRIRSGNVIVRHVAVVDLEIDGEGEQVEIFGQAGNLQAGKRLLKERVGRGVKSGLTQDAPP